MKLKLIVSLLVFAGAAFLGAQLGESDVPIEERATYALLIGYVVWALYWGAPLVIGWWWRIRHKGPFFLQLILVVLVLPTSCLFFSVYGGGIYQFLKTWWLCSKVGAQP